MRFLAAFFSPSRRTRVGPWGEGVAARHLRRQGLRLLERNYRVRSGEIDLVALDGATLVFVEVKTFSAASRSRGIDRITPAKRRRLRCAARAYLAQRRPRVEGWRVDAVLVEFELTPRRGRRVRELSWYRAILDLD